ncbi:MAG: GGDEF domain-containing protein [Candidatus Ventricola sp.]
MNCAGLLALALSLLSRCEGGWEKHLDDRLFHTMIAITMGALVAETLSFLLDGRPGAVVRCLLYLTNAYLFLASCSVGAIWVLYVDHRIYHSMKRLKKRMLVVGIPLAAIAVMIACDLFGAGIIFAITEENVYVRGRLVMLSYIILLCDYIISIVTSVCAVRQNNHARFFPILHFVLPCIAGTVIQGLFYGLSVGWFCVGIAFTFVQMQLNNQNAFVDDLSGLYNRKYYQYVINQLIGSKKRQIISGVMMDINNFKGINDQYGHNVGDKAIRQLGRVISEVITENDIAFRHAGDEFIILSTVEDETYVHQMIDALTQKIGKLNASSGNPYELSLAIGYAICKTSELDSDSFLHQMDVMMYREKRLYYERSGRDRRKQRRQDAT